MSEEVGKPIIVGTEKPTQLDMSNHMLGRKMIRSPKNSLDVCTIISILPMDLPEEVKPTIEPGRFKIPYGTYEKPGVLVVTGSSWWKDYDPTQPVLEIPNSSIQVAESVIRDFCNGLLECNMADTMPGLFFVEGKITSAEVLLKYKNKLLEVKLKQDKWFRALVRHADSVFARTNGNPLSVWELMKVAAVQLNLNDKPWLKDQQMQELICCFACGSMRNPAYPICPSCKVVDQSHPEAKNLKFAV